MPSRVIFPELRTRVCPVGERPAARAPHFVGGVTGASVAGQQTSVQLWNPGESGIIVLVTRVQVRPGAAITFSLRSHETPLGTLTRRAFRATVGAGASHAEIRQEASATPSGTVIGEYGAATQGVELLDGRRVLRLEGQRGLTVTGDANATTMVVQFEFYEVCFGMEWEEPWLWRPR